MDELRRQALEDLEDFLIELFDHAHDHLRRVIRRMPGGAALAAGLPGPTASLTELARGAVHELVRQGRLDAGFFEHLAAALPGRRAAVMALRDEVLAHAASGSPDPGGSRPDAPDVWLQGLPAPARGVFVGRDAELARLDAAWEDPGTRVISIVGWGGAGKSALVHAWLERMRARGWRGARHVYGWSFPAQGTDDAGASADAFLVDALDALGGGAVATPQMRARRLSARMKEHRALLVLDGLEPLQEPPRSLGRAGMLRDLALRSLLSALARDMNGLCVITSRLPVQDLAAQAGGAAPVLPLHRLSAADGAALLAGLGVRGSEAELRAAADEMEGHALTLSLLGTYLCAARDGDVTRRRDLPVLAAADGVDDGKTRQMLAAYDAWLSPRERAVMRLMGLFDRPAGGEALAVLRREPAIAALTDALAGVTGDDWRVALSLLRRAGLLEPESPAAPERLDTHPLVRAYFGEVLRAEQPAAWREAHARLYEHFLAGAPQVVWELADLGRAVDAVVHGCHAGRHAEVYREVYRGRIHRRRYDAITHLGAFGLDLSALAGFFERRWDRPLATLDPTVQAHVLEAVGFDLRALGRLRDALAPLQAALTMDQAAGRYQSAAAVAADLAGTYLLLGNIAEALARARAAVDLAEQSNDEYERLGRRTNLAEVLHHAGERDESAALFVEAEKLQARRQREYPLLYGHQGARYCALLLDLAAPLDGTALRVDGLAGPALAEARQRCVAVRKRVETTLGWARARGLTPFSVGLDHLTLGRAHLGLWLAARARGVPAEAPDVVAHRNQAAASLDLAVDELRQSGRDEELPRALLARAGLRRFLGDGHGAEIELGEVEEIAERSGMRLLGCDAHLERARLALAGGATGAARVHTEAARAIIADTGYRRRDRELAALDTALMTAENRSS